MMDDRQQVLERFNEIGYEMFLIAGSLNDVRSWDRKAIDAVKARLNSLVNETAEYLTEQGIK